MKHLFGICWPLAASLVLASCEGSDSVGQPGPRPEYDYAIPIASPDGRRIAVSYHYLCLVDSCRQGAVYLFNIDGSGRSRVAAEAPRGSGPPSWSPDSRRLTFTSGRKIFVVNADGSGRKRIADGDGDPIWSPDGSRIAFFDARIGGKLFVVNADGSGLRQVPQVGGRSWAMGCWLDGSHIAFVASLGENDHIHVVDVDGRTLKILSSADQYTRPGCSPDGSLVFKGGGIRVMSLDGSVIQNVAQGSSPAWSPDGERIAFARNSGGVFVVDSDGSNERRLADMTGIPTWSSDGERIIFGTRNLQAAGSHARVYIVDLDGSDLRPLTP